MIRYATRQDIPSIIEMIREGSKEMTILGLANNNLHDQKHIENLLFNIIVGRGFILIDEKLRGMLISIIVPNLWCPKFLELRQLGWWVNPEYRNKTLSGKLWIEFEKKATEFLDSGRVNAVYVSYRNKEKNINFIKHGFKPLETIFFREK